MAVAAKAARVFISVNERNVKRKNRTKKEERWVRILREKESSFESQKPVHVSIIF